MNAQLEQRIANRVRVEVAKMVQHDPDPDPETVQYGHFLGTDYGLDSLDRVELAADVRLRLALPQVLEDGDDEVGRACERNDAMVGHVIEAAKRAYVAQWGEKEVV